MFKKLNKLKKRHKILFAIFIGLSVVSFWRGAWGLMDLYVFPSNQELSIWFSFIFGLTVLYLTHYIIKELL